jgi:hypothetical protein
MQFNNKSGQVGPDATTTDESRKIGGTGSAGEPGTGGASGGVGGSALGSGPGAGPGAGGSDLGGVGGTGGGTGGGGGETALGTRPTGAGTDLGAGQDSGSGSDLQEMGESVKRKTEEEQGP